MDFIRKEDLFVLLVCILIFILFIGIHTINFGYKDIRNELADNYSFEHTNNKSAPPVVVGSVGLNSSGNVTPPTEEEMLENISYNNDSNIQKPKFNGNTFPVEE